MESKSTALLCGGGFTNVPSAVIPQTAAVAVASRRLAFKNNVCSVSVCNRGNRNDQYLDLEKQQQSSFGKVITRNNRINYITCKNVNRQRSSVNKPDDDSGKGIFPNAKAALETLLSFDIHGGQTKTKDQSLIDIRKAKRKALQSLVDGDFDDAENTMRNEYYDNKGAKHLVNQYNAGMALIEILIHLGNKENYEAALKTLDEIEKLDKNPPSDAKRFLYRAVIFTLLEKDGAEEHWKVYISSLGGGPSF